MDSAARHLDNAILEFIRRYQNADEAPEAIFQSLALRIFSYQYETNAHYRRFCVLENKNPGIVKNWKEIPAMPAEGFKEFFLTTFTARKAVRIFRTSGTTAGPRGAHFFETLKLYKASLVPPFKKYVLPDRQRMEMFFLTASPWELKDSSLSYMMGVVQKHFGISQSKNSFYVHKNKILSEKLARDLFKSRKPVMILATSFSLKSFLDYLKEKKIKMRLKRGSRLMETGGFKGRMKDISKKSLYRECFVRLGIPARFCVSEYGMTELSSQYYDGAGPAWLRALVIDPKTGREVKAGGKGILRHVDLANRGSVIAVQTQDLAVRRKKGFEILGRMPGVGLRGCSLTYEEFLNG